MGKLRVVVSVLFVSVLVASGAVAACGGADNPLEGVSTTAADDSTELIVAEFSGNADLSDAAGTKDWAERGSAVVTELKATAERDQGDARDMADEAGIDFTSFWVTNVMVFEGGDDLADRVAQLPGVESVYTEPLHPHITDAAFGDVATADVPATTWNVTAVGAPDVWAAGDDGSGARIGVIDSGVEVTHPALASSWPGDTAWFDATGECDSGPCDTAGHGTHVTGIAVGGDPPAAAGGTDTGVPHIGIAPGAEFLAAKACGEDGCAENALLAAAQWMLEPGGDAGPRPTVIVNSWDLAAGDTSLDRLPGVWRAAGQIPVFAAGNDGPGCSSVGSPAERTEAVAVGALAEDRSFDSRTSRGPGPQGATKPDLWAPGLDIISSLPGDSYGTGDGTSMAAPHVAGALAVALGDSTDTDRLVSSLADSGTQLAPPGCDRQTGSTTTSASSTTTTAPGPASMLEVPGLISRMNR